MRILDVRSLVDRLAAPIFAYRLALSNVPQEARETLFVRDPTPTQRGAVTRVRKAEREIKEVVDDVCGLRAAEERLWDRVLSCKHHERKFRSQAERAAAIGEDRRAQVLRESARLYKVSADRFVESIAHVRCGHGTSENLAHAMLDVQEEFGRKIKEAYPSAVPA